MASLENVQGAVNSQDVNLGNIATSNDLLSAGAEELARGRRAGFSDEETLGVLSRRRRHQRPNRLTNEEVAQAQQRYATIGGMTAEPGRTAGGESAFSGRQVTNSEVQFNLDGGERDQSVEDAYYGRDENEFTAWDKNRGTYDDIYIPDGATTPDALRDQALLRSWGLQKRKTGTEEVLDRRGNAVVNQEGEVIIRNTYDFENVNETTSGQGWQGGGGRAAASAIERLDGTRTGSQFSEAEVAERLRRMYGDNIPAPVVARLRENLRRTADPQQAKAVEGFFGRRAVQRSNENFSPAAKAISDARAAREAQMSISSGQAGVDAIEYLPGSLTKSYQDPEGGITIATNTGAEPDAIFGARPQAVIRNEEAVEIARALGDDVSAYVDLATGEGVEGVTPSRLQTNLPNTSQQVNAPVTTAASWVASNLREGKTGDVLADTNVSQITADFSRRVEAAAPGYRSRPVRTVESFSDQVGRVIAARQGAGKNFYEPAFDSAGQPIYTKAGRQKQQKVENPGVADVLRFLRMTSGEQGQLANALYTMETSSTGSRPVSSFSPGVQVNTGSMFGEAIDLGIAGRDSQRAAFARANDEDAQRPQIGAIRERDEFGGVTREEPPLTRAVMKGRSPDGAVATYKQQRAKNNQPVDPVYAEKIRRENASLRADQAKLDEDRAVARASEGHKRWDAPRNEAEADDQVRYRGEQVAEANERQEIIKLIKKGATTSGGDTLGGGGDRPFISPTERGRDGRPHIIMPAEKGRRLQPPLASRQQARVESPDIAPEMAERSPINGSNAVTPPAGQTEAVGPDPVSSALKREIAARVDAKRQARRRHIGGAIGAGAGVAGVGALIAALSGNQEEEQY